MPKIAGILMQKSLCKQKTIMFQVWYTSYLEFKVNSIIEKYNISIHEIEDKIILKSHLNHYFFLSSYNCVLSEKYKPTYYP